MSEHDDWYVAKTQDDNLIARLQAENARLKEALIALDPSGFWDEAEDQEEDEEAEAPAPLSSEYKIPSQFLELPLMDNLSVVATLSERDALQAKTGDVVSVLGESKTYIYRGDGWVEIV